MLKEQKELVKQVIPLPNSYLVVTQPQFSARELKVSIHQPIDDSILSEKKSWSDSLRFYAGNLYRTLVAKQNDIVKYHFDNQIWHLALDVFDKFGKRTRQCLIMISSDNPIEPKQKLKMQELLDVIRNALIDSLRESPDIKNFKYKFIGILNHYFKKKVHQWAIALASQLNITCLLTQLGGEHIYFCEKEPSEEGFPFLKKNVGYGYLLTPNKIFYFFNKKESKEISSQATIESKFFIQERKADDGKSSAELLRGLKKPNSWKYVDTAGVEYLEFDLSLNLEYLQKHLNLKISQTVLLNIGKHSIVWIDNGKKSHHLQSGGEKRLNAIYHGYHPHWIILPLTDKDYIEIQSGIDSPRELKSQELKMDDLSIYSHRSRQIIRQAEELRQQKLSQWQEEPLKFWFNLLYRLWPYFLAIESGAYKRHKVIDPFYINLVEASLENFSALQIAFESAQLSPEELEQLPKEEVSIIQSQWAEEQKNHRQKFSCRQAFESHYSTELVKFGGEIGGVSINPVTYLNQLRDCWKMDVSDQAWNSIKRKINISFPTRPTDSVLFSYNPIPSVNHVVQFDYIREDYYYPTRLTILYNSPYQIFLENFSAKLQQQIFSKKGLELLYHYDSRLEELKIFFVSLLKDEQHLVRFEDSLLICIFLEIDSKPIHILVTIGDCQAISIAANGEIRDELEHKSKDKVLKIEVVKDSNKKLFLIPHGNPILMNEISLSSSEYSPSLRYSLPGLFELADSLKRSYLPEDKPNSPKKTYGPDEFELCAFTQFLGLLENNLHQQLKFVVGKLKILTKSDNVIWNGFINAFVLALSILYFPRINSVLNRSIAEVSKKWDEVLRNAKYKNLDDLRGYSFRLFAEQKPPPPVVLPALGHAYGVAISGPTR